MKEKSKHQLRQVTALFLSLSFVLSMMVWNINLQSPTGKYSADSADSEIYGYLIGSYYIDIYSSKEGDYYVYKTSTDSEAHKVASSAEASKWGYRNNWPPVTVSSKRVIPAKFGSYSVDDVVSVDPYFPNGTLNGKTLTMQSIKDSLKMNQKPTEWAYGRSKYSIVAAGGDANTSFGYSDGISEGRNYEIDTTYKYVSSQYSPTPSFTYDKQSHQCTVFMTGLLKTRTGIEGNEHGDDWSNDTGFQKLIDDAKQIQKRIKVDQGNPGLQPKDMYAMTASKPSKISGTTSFTKWKAFWSNYLSGNKKEETFKQIWNGTYKPETSKAYRIYMPYIITVRLHTNTDIALITPKVSSAYDSYGIKKKGMCTAKYNPQENQIELKLIGCALQLPQVANGSGSPTDKNEHISIQLTNTTINTQNNFTGSIGPKDYVLLTPLNPAEEGAAVTKKTGDLNAMVDSGKGIIVFKDIKTSSETDQVISGKCFINFDKNPKENYPNEKQAYDNNVFEFTIKIPRDQDDLIAKSISPSHGDTAGSSIPITMHPSTVANVVQKTVETYTYANVEITATMGGSIIFQNKYQHPLDKEVFVKEGLSFNIPGFQPGEKTKTVKFELKINLDGPTGKGTRPPKEVTFDNNRITTQLDIVNTKPIDPPPGDQPELPHYTTFKDCFYLDKQNPNTDSVNLVELGNFTDKNYKIKISASKSSINITGDSDIGWFSSEAKQPHTNYGRVVDVTYLPVFPSNGVNGWIEPYNIGDSSSAWTPTSKQSKDCPITYEDYEFLLENEQKYATFTYYDKDTFLRSDGASLVEKNDQLKLLKMFTRIATNTNKNDGFAKYDDCCCDSCYLNGPGNIESSDYPGDNPSPSHVKFHGDIQCGPHYRTYTDDDGEEHTEVVYCTIHHAPDGSCPVGHSGTCSYCGAPGSGSPDPEHYHIHTEKMLGYISQITLEFNIKLNPLSSATTINRDYGTNSKYTRAGYSFYTLIDELDYTTDCKEAEVSSEFGQYKVHLYPSASYVRTPYTNKKPTGDNDTSHPFLISRLEERSRLANQPFAKKFWNVKNYEVDNSPFHYRNIYSDVDYFDTKENNSQYSFPIIYTVWFNLDSMPGVKFTPAPNSILQSLAGNPNNNYNKYLAYSNTKPFLPKGLGICYLNSDLQIRGNMWDDTFSHVSNPDNVAD